MIQDLKFWWLFYSIFYSIYFASIKKQSLGDACNFIKKKFRHRCFCVNFDKFLRTPFLIEHIWWLLLNILENLFPHFKFSHLRTSFVSKLHLDVKLCFMYQHLLVIKVTWTCCVCPLLFLRCVSGYLFH